MIRNFFVMLSVLFFAAGCAPSNWKVVRQAKPNPFKSGAPAFKATAIDFGSAQMAGVAKTMNKKKFKTDLSFLSRHYRKALLRSMRKDWSPFSAATLAYCVMEQGFDVDCDITFAMALIKGCGPPA